MKIDMPPISPEALRKARSLPLPGEDSPSGAEAPAAYTYAEKGWLAFPLPVGEKSPPVAGVTGRVPVEDAQQAAETAWNTPADDANLGLRMPDNVIALDVDTYGDKTGAETLAGLEEELGELPATYMSSRRGDPRKSGQRFFRVPAETKWNATAGEDIDIVQMTHRYAVAWPSTVDGLQYTWFGPDGEEAAEIPHVEDLPALPAAWIEHLKRGRRGELHGPVFAEDSAAAEEWLAEVSCNPDGAPEITPEAAAEIFTNYDGSRYDTMTAQVYQLAAQAVEGRPGVPVSIDNLKAAYVAAVRSDRARGAEEAQREFDASLGGAVAKIRGEVEARSRIVMKDAPEIPSLQASLKTQSNEYSSADAFQQINADVDGSVFEKYGGADKVGFTSELVKEKNRRAARRAADAEEREADSGQYAKPEGIDIAELLGTEFPEEQWVVKQLIEDGQQILLYSAAKQGKSYLVQELMSALSTGSAFLGQYPTTAPVGNIGLVDVELHPRKLAERLGKRDWTDNLKVYSLRGTAPGKDKLMKLNLASEESRREWVDRWKADNIEYLVLDPLSALIREAGLSEWNEGGLALRYLQQMTAEAGIRAHIVVTHASSKKDGMENGPRGDSAMLDVPDNVWKLVNDKERDTLTLTTEGRTEAVGVEADWLPGGRFRFNRAFSPFSVGEKKAKDNGLSVAAIGSNVSRTVYELAQDKAQELGITTSFHSTAWCQDYDQSELWPRNKAAMVDLIRREGGYKEGNEFRLSKAGAEKVLGSLLEKGSYFTVVGEARAGRYVPTKSPDIVRFEPAESIEVGGNR